VQQIAKGDPDVFVSTMFIIGFVPIIGLALLPWVIETRGQKMPD